MRTTKSTKGGNEACSDRFQLTPERSWRTKKREPRPPNTGLPQSTDDVLAAFATVSRRINDLARELKCLGYFDDEDDRPRAA